MSGVRGRRVCGDCGHPGHFAGTCRKYTGKRYGSWVVMRGAACPPGGAQSAYVLARCDCGVEKVVRTKHLRYGRSTSCGCSRAGLFAKNQDPPTTVTLFGAEMSLGEVSMLCERRPEHIWGRMLRGMSVEDAAFGEGAGGPRAATTKPAPTASGIQQRRSDRDAEQAKAGIDRWARQWGHLRGRDDLARVFAAVDALGGP